MGKFVSKFKRRKSSVETIAGTNDLASDILDEEIGDREKNIIEELRRDLYQNPDMFILNHMLMSIMFFENFEK